MDWSSPDSAQTTSNERIEELEREIAHLKGTVYSVNQNDSGISTPLVEQTEITNISASDQEKLNHTVEAMRWTMTVRGIMQPTKEHLAKANDMIFDEATSAKRKLVALRILNGCNKRTDEVARKMLDVYYTTSDFDIQAEIFNLLDDMDTPELATAALEASSSSPNARVRKEAIDSLSGFLPNPELLTWLKQVAASDSDKDVKREAERLLTKFSTLAAN
jgi:uncharacterized protein (UPF0335 family)